MHKYLHFQIINTESASNVKKEYIEIGMHWKQSLYIPEKTDFTTLALLHWVFFIERTARCICNIKTDLKSQ